MLTHARTITVYAGSIASSSALISSGSKDLHDGFIACSEGTRTPKRSRARETVDGHLVGFPRVV